jgi:hypothetical protein
VLVATGYFPPNIPFEASDMATVIEIINEQRKKR